MVLFYLILYRLWSTLVGQRKMYVKEAFTVQGPYVVKFSQFVIFYGNYLGIVHVRLLPLRYTDGLINGQTEW